MWTALFTRTREVDARSAAAIMAGLLDTIDVLQPSVQKLLIREATRWPDQAVRRAGLALVADREGPEAAVKLAANDPNVRVRAWAGSLMTTSETGRRTSSGLAAHATPTEEGESPTLF